MSSKLYVGGIPYSTKEDALENLFGEVGPVQSVRIITDRHTGRSRGFAFVEMESNQDADQAIEKLDGTDLGGRNISVSQAREKQGQRENRSV